MSFLFLGTCWISECGCPGAFLESWCDESSTSHRITTSDWCMESEANCNACHGVWCTGAAEDDTESSGNFVHKCSNH